jgi:multiple sugar transport system substrate-binding protein
MGYDWTPGTKEFTWERYCEVSKWIDENVPDEEVKYGSGQMAQKHDSIFCDFSNILAAYGGDYFSDKNINTLGADSFNNISVLSQNFIKALDMYKQTIKVAAPESIEWNWTDIANAFRNGEIAMMANWDENYTYIQQDSESKVNGKVGYSILPYGDVRSANIYGGSGIGINKYATEREKQASWLYIVWATSKEMQLEVLKDPEGGSLPTRKSVYEDNYMQYNIKNIDYIFDENTSLKHMAAVLEAWETENLYLRPKISNFYEVEQVIISNLYEMIKFDIDSLEISKKIYAELSDIKYKD